MNDVEDAQRSIIQQYIQYAVERTHYSSQCIKEAILILYAPLKSGGVDLGPGGGGADYGSRIRVGLAIGLIGEQLGNGLGRIVNAGLGQQGGQVGGVVDLHNVQCLADAGDHAIDGAVLKGSVRDQLVQISKATDQAIQHRRNVLQEVLIHSGGIRELVVLGLVFAVIPERVGGILLEQIEQRTDDLVCGGGADLVKYRVDDGLVILDRVDTAQNGLQTADVLGQQVGYIAEHGDQRFALVCSNVLSIIIAFAVLCSALDRADCAVACQGAPVDLGQLNVDFLRLEQLVHQRNDGVLDLALVQVVQIQVNVHTQCVLNQVVQ